MSKTQKPRIFFAQGVTAPLVDGQTRTVMLVAVLTSKQEERVLQSESEQESKTSKGVKFTQVLVTEVNQVTEYTLSFGLAVTAPNDTHDPEVGKSIALGKAFKEKSALAVIKTDNAFFTKNIILSMLYAKLKHITEAPDKFIRVSPAKAETEPAV